jgi:hypothetical protein
MYLCEIGGKFVSERELRNIYTVGVGGKTDCIQEDVNKLVSKKKMGSSADILIVDSLVR